jgi:hypothetical protein
MSNNQGGNQGGNRGNKSRNNASNNIGNNNISFLMNDTLMNNGNENAGRGGKNGNKGGNGNGRGKGNGNFNELQKQLAMNETLAMMMGARATFGSIEKNWDTTPFGVKMGYLFILGAILYYYLIVNYNLYGVVVAGILLAGVVFMWSLFLSILVILVLVLVIYFKRSERVRLGGTLIEGTKIVDHEVYKGKRDHLFVSSGDLPKELEVGTFSYSFWLYLNKPPTNGKVYRSGKWKSVFYRGSKLDTKNDLSSLTQYLGVWLKPDNQTLAFVFQQNGAQNESIEFSDIEYGEWMYFVVNCTKNSVNIFKNGKLEVSSSLQQNPVSMNDYGIYVTSDYGMAQMDLVSGDISTGAEDNNADNDTGFDGYLAYLTYYVENLGVDEIGTVMSFYKAKVDAYESWKAKMLASDLDSFTDLITDSSS